MGADHIGHVVDRATGKPVERHQRDQPGELIHVGVKRIPGIPDGGGHRTRGRGYIGKGAVARKVGYRYIHTALGDRIRLVYSEILDDEGGGHRREVLGTRRRALRRMGHPLWAGDH